MKNKIIFICALTCLLSLQSCNKTITYSLEPDFSYPTVSNKAREINREEALAALKKVKEEELYKNRPESFIFDQFSSIGIDGFSFSKQNVTMRTVCYKNGSWIRNYINIENDSIKTADFIFTQIDDKEDDSYCMFDMLNHKYAGYPFNLLINGPSEKAMETFGIDDATLRGCLISGGRIATPNLLSSLPSPYNLISSYDDSLKTKSFYTLIEEKYLFEDDYNFEIKLVVNSTVDPDDTHKLSYLWRFENSLPIYIETRNDSEELTFPVIFKYRLHNINVEPNYWPNKEEFERIN